MADLLVYAVGDSVMWGEGLSDEDKFAMRAATSLAQARGLTPRLRMLAHCGAKIKAGRDDDEETARKERQGFADRFPFLFNAETERRFVHAVASNGLTDETPTERMHGEIPRAFPTIRHQLHRISDGEGPKIDVLLINGGANDIDFETVFTTPGNFLKDLDDDYRRIFHDDIIQLLSFAREKCPNAAIVLTGYYSAFSLSSDFDAMKRFGLVAKSALTMYKSLSAMAVVAAFLDPVLIGLGLDLFKDSQDKEIRTLIAQARATSEASESRAHYWLRRAVREINNEPSFATIRGPGVIFASPGFLPDNCVFAPDSFIWQEYESDKLLDPQAERRVRECPRIGLNEDMQRCRNNLHDAVFEALRLETEHEPTLDFSNPEQAKAQRFLIEAVKAQAEDLRKLLAKIELDGPRTLHTALKDLIESTPTEKVDESSITTRRHRDRFRKAMSELKHELDRIDVTLISSFIHPDPRGAARYAAVVRKRAEELDHTSVRERLLAFLPPEQRKQPPAVLEVGKVIRRFSLDPASGLRACLAHAEPDVLGLVVHTHKDSTPLFSLEELAQNLMLFADQNPGFLANLFLDLGAGKRWGLRHLVGRISPHFQPGTRDFFTIDVSGQISIGDITRTAIELREVLSKGGWMPESITLSIDGRDVFHRRFDVPPKITHILPLDYPREQV
jgi:hypothetical protein